MNGHHNNVLSKRSLNYYSRSLPIISFKLFASATPLTSQQIDELCSHYNVLTKNSHPQRFLSFYNSRMALLQVLQKQFIETDLYNLQITNNLHLEKFPQFLTSISHTEEIGAAIIAPNGQLQSIGLDIEKKSRKMKNGSQKFFVSPLDESNFNNLEIWCIKEAAYKAIHPVMIQKNPQAQLVLSEIWINQKNSTFGTTKDSCISGKFEIKTRNFKEQELLVAMAFIDK